MLGGSAAGKHSLFERFLYDKFRPIKNCIIGADFNTKKMNINGKDIKAQIWITSGNENYRPMLPFYLKGVDGIILVYDIIEENSFKEMKEWFEELKKHVDSKVIITLVGNKCDLESQRIISYETGKKFAEENNFFSFEETSAMNSINVEKVFNDILKKIVEKKL
uniref:Uncharacterized protein n=1 Tax=Panagrolaimus sp. PS1159 TaxID=55785 RepID=A0AC35FQH3_9BILA